MLIPLTGYKGDLDDLNMSVASFKDIVMVFAAENLPLIDGEESRD